MRPIPADRLLAIRGQVGVVNEKYALKPSPDGYLEARIPSLAIPAKMTLAIDWTSTGADEPFDVVFPSYSVANDTTNFMLPPTPIPDSLAGILAALRDDQHDARSVLDGSGIFAYAPAIRARDHLLALDEYVMRLAPAAQPRAGAAVRAAMRAAWLLHIASDAGISPWQVSGSVDVLTGALDDVVAAFGGGASR
jgi:hypothetical protein